jgi:hypothetical protein
MRGRVFRPNHAPVFINHEEGCLCLARIDAVAHHSLMKGDKHGGEGRLVRHRLAIRSARREGVLPAPPRRVRVRADGDLPDGFQGIVGAVARRPSDDAISVLHQLISG